MVWNQEGSKIAYATYENKTIDIYTINAGKPYPVKPPAGEPPSEKQPGVPGFEAVFAIGGLLAVAYLLRRVKRNTGMLQNSFGCGADVTSINLLQ